MLLDVKLTLPNDVSLFPTVHAVSLIKKISAFLSTHCYGFVHCAVSLWIGPATARGDKL